MYLYLGDIGDKKGGFGGSSWDANALVLLSIEFEGLFISISVSLYWLSILSKLILLNKD